MKADTNQFDKFNIRTEEATREESDKFQDWMKICDLPNRIHAQKSRSVKNLIQAIGTKL
jgi:hypothetical protein